VVRLTLWFQSVLGASPLGAGLRLLALTLLVLVFAPVGGRLGGVVPARHRPRLRVGGRAVDEHDRRPVGVAQTGARRDRARAERSHLRFDPYNGRTLRAAIWTIVARGKKR
jgi:hypothetical protein